MAVAIDGSRSTPTAKYYLIPKIGGG